MHIKPTSILVAAAVSICSVQAQPAVSRRDVAGVFTSLYLVYDSALLTERYRTEHGAIPLANGPAELSRAIFGDDGAAKNLIDPWGTPLHIESTPGKGYLIVAAGSDRTFDHATWSERAATTTPADDIVFRDGELIRSPVDWATLLVFSAPDLAQAAERIRIRERHATTVSNLRALFSGIITYSVSESPKIPTGSIEDLRKALVPKYAVDRFTDGWERPFAIASDASGKSYVIASAGPDGKFDRESWNNPSRETDDIVLTADGNIRNADLPIQKLDAAAADTDRLLEAYATFKSALSRFQQQPRR